MTYASVRTIHLLCGAFALPGLLMYGLSAVQMANSKWFNLKPAVTESDLQIGRARSDGRTVALDVMSQHQIRGEITAVTPTPAGFNVRIVVPGTVHEIKYDAASGSAHVRTSRSGFWGMLNRLHHAAGLAHSYTMLNIWGVVVALVSVATLGLGVTGIWMWWLRRQERFFGVILLALNLAFTIIVLVWLRMSGP